MSSQTWRMPGEFEPQQAVIVAWNEEPAFMRGQPLDPVHLAEVRALVGRVRVIVATTTEAPHERIRRVLKEGGVDPADIEMWAVAEQSEHCWPRDYGPECGLTADGEVGHVDMDFNNYGFRFPPSPGARRTEAFDRVVAGRLGIPEHGWSRLASEGGDREFDGRGTLMTVEQTELQRNPGRTRDEIEAEYRRLFGLDQVIWLPTGTYEDDHPALGPIPGPDGRFDAYRAASANGHVDEMARFVGPGTILLAEVTEAEAQDSVMHAINRARLDAAAAVIAGARTAGGEPFRVVRMPVPEPIYLTLEEDDWFWREEMQPLGEVLGGRMFDGSRWPRPPFPILPAQSYCNFLITNGAVLGQCYWHPGLPDVIAEKDQRAEATLAELFPDRAVTMIDVLALNIGGGGAHCNTMDIPAPH